MHNIPHIQVSDWSYLGIIASALLVVKQFRCKITVFILNMQELRVFLTCFLTQISKKSPESLSKALFLSGWISCPDEVLKALRGALKREIEGIEVLL